jgi:hypothetical protein
MTTTQRSAMNRRTKILGLLAALILGQLLFAGSASADHFPRHYIKSPTLGRCLLGGQINSGGTGWAGTWPCEPTWWQVWEWNGHFDPNTYTTIRGVPQGACLDSNEYGDVYMLKCNYGGNQYWRVTLNDQRLAVIENFATGLCLQEPSQGGEVFTYYCQEGNRKQSWRFVGHPHQ